MDYLALAQNCAPKIDPALMVRLVRRESSFNAYAIGLDGRASLRPQPRSFDEAVETAERLIQQGVLFSAGPAQLHISNIRRFGLTWRQVFHPCTNLHYAQSVFLYFHGRALKAGLRDDAAVFAALRGYNSGNIFGAVSNAYAAAIQTGSSARSVPSLPASRPMLPSRAAARREEGEAVDFFDES